MKAKSIFRSKTFWLNVLGSAAFVAGGGLGVHVPTPVAVPIMGVANILNRFLTVQPVTVLPTARAS